MWRDLLTRDVSAAKRFYEELFGWRFEETHVLIVRMSSLERAECWSRASSTSARTPMPRHNG